MGRMPLSVRRLLPSIHGLILDIDGILTDGRLVYSDTEEAKTFHVRDGHGLALLVRAGFPVGVISGRAGSATERRLEELGIRDYFLGIRDKIGAFETLLDRWRMNDTDVGMMGDDITDLPLLERAGLSITVPDAHPVVRRQAAWLTTLSGGGGAVREVADALLFVMKRGRLPAQEGYLC